MRSVNIWTQLMWTQYSPQTQALHCCTRRGCEWCHSSTDSPCFLHLVQTHRKRLIKNYSVLCILLKKKKKNFVVHVFETLLGDLSLQSFGRTLGLILVSRGHHAAHSEVAANIRQQQNSHLRPRGCSRSGNDTVTTLFSPFSGATALRYLTVFKPESCF